jgi:ABC-type multidrug transport system ATPase subunit/pSer/pThr/pTyr-binding forkhead associated (FHA) protein
LAGMRLVVRMASQEKVVLLREARLSLGRVDDRDIVVDSPVISRNHAELVREGLTYRYVHLSATNPSLLDGRPIREHPLRDGDVISIGAGSKHEVSLLFLSDTLAPASGDTFMGATALGPSDTVLTIGREQGSDIVLASPLVSRRHARLIDRDGSRVLEDLGSTNGTFVNGVRVQRAVLAASDIIRIGPYKLTFDGRTLKAFDEARSVRLEAMGLCQDVKGARILDQVSFVALPGQLTVIAGTSGSGKSTLIDALNGLRPASSGSVLINGTDLYSNLQALRPLMGYVPQSDVLHRELPLRRALFYSARLRLPPDISRNEIASHVENVLAELELSERQELPIKNLSGGQQKRASIAAELLTEPPLFFLDEPTSGLDPGLTVKLMQLLRRLATNGKTIILVSHDPDTLGMCDQLVFLAAGGKVAYVGPPNDALKYFRVQTFAEIYAKVESEGTAEDWKEQFIASPFTGALGDQSASSPRAEKRPLAPPAEREVTRPEAKGADARQWGWLTLRYGEIMLRDVRNLAILLLQAPIIGLFLALVSREDTLIRADDPTSASKLLLLLSISAIWLGTINSAREIVKELSVFRRERMAGVKVWPYVLSKAAVLTVVSAFQVWLLLYVVGLRVSIPGQGPVASGGMEIYLSLFLTSVAALGLGLFISTLASTQERAISLVPLLLIPQVIFAGVIFDLSGISHVISWLVISKWSVQLLGTTAHLPGGEYSFTSMHLLTRWTVLAVMGAGSLWATAKLLERADRRPAGARPLRVWGTLLPRSGAGPEMSGRKGGDQ